ncbi:carboxylesterase family protein [Amycolatopsis sp., V23-08]|uniref:Carboxylic ester hydrolase n=1 Tax=Amycolatopsis heterodermiae TaxID=3110235 RepID=A0ABU5R4L7_9PSEU|nr:carboxylesterase family protein [Amycolatopsis sp., V23-08]MEA5360639.1 carboxylesterase family protein [Amycolatopsis sp., V23-08]
MTALTRIAGGLAALLVLAACSSRAPEEPSLTVGTTTGQVHGLATASAREFLGVRYALAPTGERRWSAPQPVPAQDGVADATHPGARCSQGTQTAGTSEDCLFLNVTTPRDQRPGERLPVMVWWHGGGYTSGSGADYDAQRLASRGRVVVVTVNYRLGVFGYLGLPGLAGSGNFGFADQLAATQWAKDNAAAFGGDPGNLTVFGESAGGMSACALLTSPRAAGLVERVAISSGSCFLNWPAGGLFPGTPAQTPYTSLATDQADGVAAAKQLGCTGADALPCLRKLPVDKLLPLNAAFSDHLAYGTDLLPENPPDAVRAGRIARVPVLSGGNHDEARSFMGGAAMADPSAITEATYTNLARTAYGDPVAMEVLQEYPIQRYPTAVEAWSTVVTDSAWSCPTLAGNQALARSTKVFPYEFAEAHAPNVSQVTVPGMAQGAAHATDTPYLFDLGGKNLLGDAAQARLGERMIDLWSGFARTGTPPGAVAGTATSATVLSLTAAGSTPVDTGSDHHCGFWLRKP